MSEQNIATCNDDNTTGKESATINFRSEIQVAIREMETGLQQGFGAAEKLYIPVAALMFAERTKTKNMLKGQKLRRFSGEYAEARRIIAYYEHKATVANKQANRQLINYYGHAAKTATHACHYLSTLSSERMKELRGNYESLNEEIKSIKLRDAEKAYKSANKLSENEDNATESSTSVHEELSQRLAGHALLKEMKSDTYLAPPGQIYQALIRVGNDSFDVVDIFHDQFGKMTNKLADQIQGPPPNTDSLAGEALFESILLRDKHFPPIKIPQSKQSADGVDAYHSQIVVSGSGAEILCAYPNSEARPSIRIIPKSGVQSVSKDPVTLRPQSINDAVKKGLLEPQCRQMTTLSTAGPGDEDSWVFRFEFGRSNRKSWKQCISAFLLTHEHERDPLAGNHTAFNPTASLKVKTDEFRKFYYETLAKFRGSDHLKKGKHPALHFQTNGMQFCVFEQETITINGTGKAPNMKKPKPAVHGADLVTSLDCIREIYRNNPVDIATDGKGLVRISTENTIGRYEVFMPTIPIGCLLYTSPSPRDLSTSRMPSSA